MGMAPPYSTDLRWRIVWAALTFNSSPDVARLFNVSARIVTRYLNLFLQTGDVIPRCPHYGPYPLMGDYEQLILLRLILERPGIYLSEIQRKFFDMFGVEISVSTILCRTLKFMGCSRQKIQYVALQRSDVYRARYMAEIAMHDPAMLVFIDETGSDRRNGQRRRGYSVRGIPPRDHRLLIRGVRYSGIAVMSLEGVHDMTFTSWKVL